MNISDCNMKYFYFSSNVCTYIEPIRISLIKIENSVHEATNHNVLFVIVFFIFDSTLNTTLTIFSKTSYELNVIEITANRNLILYISTIFEQIYAFMFVPICGLPTFYLIAK